ncbi:hydroxylamine reductase [Oceanirhabdus sp. W0125-5]|uniref:hydroxylamine reductase n=1 Tax=Oceanirhabdus sp. W0125-5 TaxID=2999116 RepID=UPI0022F2D4A4|nr:hydroxylamine reductase [Oceanirhabdus sp. W0125-5]WBW94678.1 hydroxylamine reductase [Oceanirhabdus sp. W0125-5]
MDTAMFCYQCEQTAGSKGCTKVGVCSKAPDTAKMQDVLILQLKGLGYYCNEFVKKGEEIWRETADFIMEGCFATLTNVNFDNERFLQYIKRANHMKKCIIEKFGSEGAPEGADFMAPETIEEILALPDMPNLGVMDDENLDMDIRSLREMLIYGLKGMSAYAHHAFVQGGFDKEVVNGMARFLGETLRKDITVEELFNLNMELGKCNLKCMEVLDNANTGNYGHPEPTEMLVTKKKGPFIVVSGHDLRDLKELLEQTEGKGVNIYTHGEMLPGNAYPELKKHKHLIGNFGGAWQEQQKEFDNLPGCILMTSNCLMKPRDSYKDRLYTTSIVGWEGVKHIEYNEDQPKDFSEMINQAIQLGGFKEDEPEKRITVGFGRNAVLSNAEAIIEAVKGGKIRHFFLVGGCDGARPGRNYYTEFAEKAPDDTIILTLACGKFRFNMLNLGTVAGFPKVLDVGQCNDAYGAIQIALALANAFECDVNELPLSYIISWYEQKAVVVLLTMLSLGLKNIYLGPTLPAFITPNILQVLVDKFGIGPVSTPEKDLEKILGNN